MHLTYSVWGWGKFTVWFIFKYLHLVKQSPQLEDTEKLQNSTQNLSVIHIPFTSSLATLSSTGRFSHCSWIYTTHGHLPPLFSQTMCHYITLHSHITFASIILPFRCSPLFHICPLPRQRSFSFVYIQHGSDVNYFHDFCGIPILWGA